MCTNFIVMWFVWFSLLLLHVSASGTCTCHCCLGVGSTMIGSTLTVTDCVTSVAGTMVSTQTGCTKDACASTYPTVCPDAFTSGTSFTIYETTTGQGNTPPSSTATTARAQSPSPSPSPSPNESGPQDLLWSTLDPAFVIRYNLIVTMLCVLGVSLIMV